MEGRKFLAVAGIAIVALMAADGVLGSLGVGVLSDHAAAYPKICVQQIGIAQGDYCGPCPQVANRFGETECVLPKP